MEAAAKEMGLTAHEYQEILRQLGREPNLTELGMFAVLWSEHCSYKHSKPLLKRLPAQGPRVLVGPGENAGVVDIGAETAVAIRIESHNHPSAIEPYQGAATGIGGIVRDVLSQGARPIALLDSLRFGTPDDARTRYIVGGVVAGIAGYGNCIGVPTVGGEVVFEESYKGNPLVNVMCVGTIEKSKIVRGFAHGVGNPVIYVGPATGRDGIHGATFASAELNEASEEKRPSVQVGDPFSEKLVIEACLELAQTPWVVGIQDMGAAGLTSSCAETAARAGNGIEIDIALVPRREQGMTAYEIMLSESQERMLVIAQAGHEEEVHAICRKWGLPSVTIGRVTDDGMFRVLENGVVAAEVPARALTDGAPMRHVQSRRPDYLDEVQAFDPNSLPEPQTQEEYTAALKALLGSPTIASKEWVYRQYDHMVRTNTVVPPGAGDAAVLRVKGTAGPDGKGGKGIAVTTDCNGRHVYLDPYVGAAAAVAEAARNCACTGAEPVAVTNCLNFGNPERPEVYWTLEQAIDGMGAACRALNTPVVGGNVSLYNETDGKPVYPTPVIGMLGVLDDIEQRCTPGFKESGNLIVLLGDLDDALGGSEYLKVQHGVIAGRLPKLDLSLEKRVQKVCIEAIRAGLVRAAHDCADGGLAVALCEMAFLAAPGARGLNAEVPCRRRGDGVLFGEGYSRIVLEVRRGDWQALRRVAKEHDVAAHRLGEVADGRVTITLARPETRPEATELLRRDVAVSAPVEELERVWKEAIPCAVRG